jgi:hypothetical protein
VVGPLQPALRYFRVCHKRLLTVRFLGLLVICWGFLVGAIALFQDFPLNAGLGVLALILGWTGLKPSDLIDKAKASRHQRLSRLWALAGLMFAFVVVSLVFMNSGGDTASKPAPTFPARPSSASVEQDGLPVAPTESAQPVTALTEGPPPEPNLRTWTSAGGHTVEAELHSTTGDKVKLMRRNGRVMTVTIDRLSPADKKFIDEWRKRKLRF